MAACDKTHKDATPAPSPPVVAARVDAGAAPAREQQQAALPFVVFVDDKGTRTRVAVEVARTEEERRVGLMYRQHLPPDAGMIFLFREDEIHTFWMKNTLIPLDMIFLRADGSVAGVVEKAEPLTETGRTIGTPSRHVLEVNGGWARAHGIVPGMRTEYENLSQEKIE